MCMHVEEREREGEWRRPICTQRKQGKGGERETAITLLHLRLITSKNMGLIEYVQPAVQSMPHSRLMTSKGPDDK